MDRGVDEVGEIPWYLDAIYYQVYTRGFYDSNGDGIGDFQGLTSKLDYIRDLGADCLWLMPHYVSPRKDDGYDIADFFQVDPDYGTLDDFQRLVEACHARGLRIITDLVLNHVSDQHPWFQEARRDRRSRYRDYFVWSEAGTEYPEAKVIFPEVKDSNWTRDEVAGRYYWHRFYAEQPDLNYDHPPVPEKMIEVARFWLSLGVDGFRVDAIPYLYERPGTDGENLPETHAFCQRLRAMLDAEFPEAVLLCEANQRPRELLPYLGADGVPEFQLGFHFPLMTQLFLALATGDMRYVSSLLQDQPELPAGTGLVSFLRNHDEMSLSGSGSHRQLMLDTYAHGMERTVNAGLPRRLAPLLGNDRRRVEWLHAVLLGLDQPVCFYYGDEIGMGDDLSRDDRHTVRTPMQWTAGIQGGFSHAETTYTRVIDDPEYGYAKVNVEAANRDPEAWLHRFRQLIAWRKASPALRGGRLEWADSTSSVLAWWRIADGERLFLVYNGTDEAQPLPADLPAARRLYASSQGLDGSGDGLEPYGWRWWTIPS